MRLLPSAMLSLFVLASIALGGPNAGGTLVIHNTGVEFSNIADLPVPPPSAPPATCDEVDNSLPGSAPTTQVVWKVYAAFPEGRSPRLKALAWGITGVGPLYVSGAGLPDPPHCFQIVSGSWPSPPGSIGQSFLFTQTSHMVECYWFGGYGYGGVFGTGPHSVQESDFVDDAVYGNVDAIAGFSTIGFGVAGNTVCPVPPPTGACCHPDGTCEVVSQDACLPPNHFVGGDCLPGLCPITVTGACCFPDLTCVLLSSAECAAAGGTFHGGSCAPNPCPQPPTGACCFASGSCSMLTESACAAAGGDFLDGSCSPNPCPQPPGACCFPDLTCVLLSSAECAAAGGAYYGGTCVPNPCGAPPPGGGDTIANATIISSLPFTDAGTTLGFSNDYDEVCPYSGSTAADVVYSYVAGSNVTCLNVDLCYSSYDTKVYIYENAQGNLIACNDDFYFAAPCYVYSSALRNVEVTPGNTYYIVIDGYGSSSGNYLIDVTACTPPPPPPPMECPDYALQENEPPCSEDYIDHYNGGCNSTPPIWQELDAVGGGCATVCGLTCQDLYYGYRDTDWFESVGLGGNVDLSCITDFDYLMALMYGADCGNLLYIYTIGIAGMPGHLSYPITAGDRVWSFMAASAFSGVPSGRYVLEVCNIEGGATSTETTSWGSIKARFLNPAARPFVAIERLGPGASPRPDPTPPAVNTAPRNPVPVLLDAKTPPRPPKKVHAPARSSAGRTEG